MDICLAIFMLFTSMFFYYLCYEVLYLYSIVISIHILTGVFCYAMNICIFKDLHVILSISLLISILTWFYLFLGGQYLVLRNICRSLLGIGMIAAGLSAKEQARRHNVLALTLGPHGTMFKDVVDSLDGLRQLDRGIEVDWYDDQKMRVFGFVLGFLGDMPQQADGAGFKRPTSTIDKGCHFCYVSAEKWGDIAFDIVKEDRSYFRLLQQRQQAQNLMHKTPREKAYQIYSLSENQTPLFHIAPALNLVSCFPSDPCHSEYGGISKMWQELLISGILSTKSLLEFSLLAFHSPKDRLDCSHLCLT